MAKYIVLTCSYHREKDRWVGICNELGTSTFAATLEEVKERLTEATELHINTLEDVKERERFFKENHIIVLNTKPRKSIPVQMPADADYFVSPCIQELTPV
jgi:predicted RNase H-like HicB family nuclease